MSFTLLLYFCNVFQEFLEENVRLSKRLSRKHNGKPHLSAELLVLLRKITIFYAHGPSGSTIVNNSTSRTSDWLKHSFCRPHRLWGGPWRKLWNHCCLLTLQLKPLSSCRRHLRSPSLQRGGTARNEAREHATGCVANSHLRPPCRRCSGQQRNRHGPPQKGTPIMNRVPGPRTPGVWGHGGVASLKRKDGDFRRGTFLRWRV